LVQVYGLGALLLGPSGIGKSECALELVRRGHTLVADDVVELERRGNRLWGRSPELIRYHMELRGVGIVSVLELFGAAAVRDEASIALACHLETWRPGSPDVERVGLERPQETWEGVPLPSFRLPARPAGSLATLVEVAVRDTQARGEGTSAAERLDRRLREDGRGGG
jgi:HPr kinase/phosphorylase